MGAASLRRHQVMRASAAANGRPPSPFVSREEHDAAVMAAARATAVGFATRIADLEASLAGAAEKVASAGALVAERDQRIADLEASLPHRSRK